MYLGVCELCAPLCEFQCWTGVCPAQSSELRQDKFDETELIPGWPALHCNLSAHEQRTCHRDHVLPSYLGAALIVDASLERIHDAVAAQCCDAQALHHASDAEGSAAPESGRPRGSTNLQLQGTGSALLTGCAVVEAECAMLPKLTHLETRVGYAGPGLTCCPQ